MGSIAVACYKPRPGCEQALLDLVRNHLPPLRAEGLVTERASIVMRTADGTIVEVFEWVSKEAIAGAHSNPVVLDLWKKFEAVCFYETPSNLPEFQNMLRTLRRSEPRSPMSSTSPSGRKEPGAVYPDAKLRSANIAATRRQDGLD